MKWTPSADELRLGSNDLHYEAAMLRDVGILLHQLPPDTSQSLRNAVVESFAIHVRCLLDFFFPRPNARDRDLVARHFAPGWHCSWQGPRDLQWFRDKADKGIAHLSYDRLKYDNDDDKPWEVVELMNEFERLLAQFVPQAAGLSAKWANWQPIAVRVRGPADGLIGATSPTDPAG